MSTWIVGTVRRAGPAENGTIYVALSDNDGAFGSTWFRAEPAVDKEMLATALTAISAGKNVTARLSDVAAYSVLERLYVMD